MLFTLAFFLNKESGHHIFTKLRADSLLNSLFKIFHLNGSIAPEKIALTASLCRAQDTICHTLQGGILTYLSTF